MPAEDPTLSADATASDPTADTQDPTAATDDAAMPEDDAAMEDEAPVEDDTENNGDTSEIDELWGQLDTEDKAAAIKYVKSMVDDGAEDSEEEMPEDTGEEVPEDTTEAAPMMESFRFTKGQFKKLHSGK